MRGGVAVLVLRFARGLRFPYLFALTAVLFVASLLLPDTLPLVDEILIGLVTLLLGSLRKSRASRTEQPTAVENKTGRPEPPGQP
jgi:hypothetical protein